MKMKGLFFDNDASDSYFHLCEYVEELAKKGKIRWFRKLTGGHKENWLSVHRDGRLSHPLRAQSLGAHTHALNDTSVFDYLMDKFGTLEGTYAEWEL